MASTVSATLRHATVSASDLPFLFDRAFPMTQLQRRAKTPLTKSRNVADQIVQRFLDFATSAGKYRWGRPPVRSINYARSGSPKDSQADPGVAIRKISVPEDLRSVEGMR